MAFTFSAPSLDLRRWWSLLPLERMRTAAKTAIAMPLGAQQLRRQRTSTLLSLVGVTASLLVIFAQLGIERAVYFSSVRIHRAVVSDLLLVPAGFKSLQIHSYVVGAMTDVVAANPLVASTSAFWFDIMTLNHPGMKNAASDCLVCRRRGTSGDRRARAAGKSLQAARGSPRAV